jgi:branched-chain amino acid transport system substrate-binding protein
MHRFAGTFVTALVLFFASVSPTPVPADTATGKGVIRVGLLDPAGGTPALEGSEVDAGFRYFLATHGDRLGGFSVDLKTGDEGATPDAALASARTLVEQDAVDAIVGVLNSSDAYAIAPYVDTQKKLLVITGAGADELTQSEAKKTIFRVAHTSSQDVMPLGDYVCHRMRLKTAVVVATDYPYGIEAAGGFARAYTDSRCRILQELYAPVGTSDWGPVVAKIDKRAQVVFAAVGGVDSVPFVTAYRAAGTQVPLTGDGILTDETWLPDERERALGIITGSHYAATLNNKTNVAFRIGYESVTGHRVSQFVENGYVAAAVLSAALDKLPPGTVKGDDLLAALRAIAVDAPRGPVHFDKYQQLVDNVYIRQVRQVGGRFRNEVIATFPNVSQFWQYDAQHFLALPPYSKLKGAWARP